MTTLDMSNLTDLADITFEEFVILHFQGHNRAEIYYTALGLAAETANLENVVNYSTLAKSVVTQGSVNGLYANGYTNVYAVEGEVDFSVSSTARLRMQYELMRADEDLRGDRISQGGTGELNYQDTINIHTAALGAIGLPKEAFSLYTPLTILAEHSPTQAQTLFEKTIEGDGLLDLLDDGLVLGFGSTISAKQPFSDILDDYGDQAIWLSNTNQALQNIVSTYPDPEAVEGIQLWLNAFELLTDATAGAFHGVSDFAVWVPSLSSFAGEVSEVIGWILGSLTSVTTAINQTSPLVLDLDGDGVKLAALNGTGSVYWDGDQDGMAEASGWVSPQDGLLALDWNNDGIVTSHAELFGTKTTDGFVVLEALDTDGNNIINANDTEFSRLLVWRDANSDGYSQEGELHTLSSLGITAISLNESAVNYTISGNRISSQSTFTMNGQSRTIVDAWFSYDDVNTTYAGDYTLDVRALFLPTLRGYGDIADLHIAMSRDEDLLLLVQDVATHDLSALLAPSYGLEDKIRDILYRWEWVKNKLASNDNWQCPWHRSLCRFAA